MRVHRLTDVAIANIKPPDAGQVVYRDGGSPLQLRVSAGGSKTFYVVVGQGKRHTIGRYGEVTLAQARDVARRIRAEKTLGKYRQRALTWEAARDEFLAYAKGRNRPRTWSEYKRTLTSYFPFKRNLHDITPKDVANKLSAIAALSQRDHALAYLRIFFRWALRQNFIDTDPTAGLQKTKAPSRTRLLTDDEMRVIWQATEEPATFNWIVRLLILTGQRRNEIASLKPEYIRVDLCTLPATLTKNRMEHIFPVGIASELFPKTTTSAYLERASEI